MIILLGPSASGKTEAAKLIKEKYKISKVVTYTTRAMRVNEVNGRDYNFVSKEEFLKLKDENFFVETTLYNGNYYGTARKDIQDNKIVVLDPNGVKAYKDLNDSHIVSFYLDCSDKTRYERMIARLDKKEDALRRIENDKEAFKKELLEGIDFFVDSEHLNIDEVASYIYKVYMDRIK